MDRDWLRARLEEGRSIESIAREVGKHPSTVGYRVKKLGLASTHAERHAPRGGIDREQLERLVADRLTVEQIAIALDRGHATVRYWLKRHGLATVRARSLQPAEVGGALRSCRRHGFTAFVRTHDGHWRCKRCRVEAVSARRRRVKQILLEEAGGACVLCGYDRYAGALQVHHVDPGTKAFALADGGLARSLARARTEAAKCVLVCANCHAEIEAGLATIAPTDHCRLPCVTADARSTA